MAKKSSKTDRQAVIDEIRKKQKGAEKRRGYAIVGVCYAGRAADRRRGGVPPGEELVGPAQVQGHRPGLDRRAGSVCEKVETEQAEGSSEHEPLRSRSPTTTAPPAFGSHWNEPGQALAPISRKLYTAKDRPELEALVHNLEHGYTMLWYDEIDG